MDRRAASPALVLLVTAVIFIFLTRDVVVGGGGHDGSCTGGQISDDGTHAAYVAHVLSELATVTPTTPKLSDITVFPGNGVSGSVLGAAACFAPSDAGVCASCLSELQPLLFGSCGTWSVGYIEKVSVCAMGFRSG